MAYIAKKIDQSEGQFLCGMPVTCKATAIHCDFFLQISVDDSAVNDDFFAPGSCSCW